MRAVGLQPTYHAFFSRTGTTAGTAHSSLAAHSAIAQALTYAFAFMLAAAFACLLCAVLGTNPAYADEDDEAEATENALVDDNLVNTQQLPDSSFIYETSIDDLSTADTYYDNQTLQVTGEAVGDDIRAEMNGSYHWITLASDDGNSTLAVYMTEEATSKIVLLGAYNVTGTTLQVRGEFHLACDEHSGGTDLHAETVSVVSPGTTYEDEFDYRTFIPGIALVVIGLFLVWLFRVMRERRR